MLVFKTGLLSAYRVLFGLLESLKSLIIQPTFTCSKQAMVKPEQCVKLFKFKNKDTRFDVSDVFSNALVFPLLV